MANQKLEPDDVFLAQLRNSIMPFAVDAGCFYLASAESGVSSENVSAPFWCTPMWKILIHPSDSGDIFHTVQESLCLWMHNCIDICYFHTDIHFKKKKRKKGSIKVSLVSWRSLGWCNEIHIFYISVWAPV